MIRVLMAGMVTVLFAIGASSQARPMTELETTRAKDVMATIAKWAEAVRDGNTANLENIFEDQLIVTAPDGKVRGKAGELAVLKPNAQSTFVSITNDDLAIRVFGDTAVATGLANMRMKNSGKEMRTAFRYTSVWVLKDGRWQLAALHTSRPN